MFASSSRKWPAMCVLESYVGLRLLLGVSFFFSQDVIAIGGMTYVPTRPVRSSRPVCVRVNTGTDNRSKAYPSTTGLTFSRRERSVINFFVCAVHVNGNACFSVINSRSSSGGRNTHLRTRSARARKISPRGSS